MKDLKDLVKELSFEIFYYIEVNVNIDIYAGRRLDYYLKDLCRKAKNLKVGDVYLFGRFNNFDINWRYNYYAGSIKRIESGEENYKVFNPSLYYSIRRLVGVIKCCLCE